MSETHAAVPSAYPPASEFAAQANATEDLYRQAEQDRLAFWAEQAESAVLGHTVHRGAGLGPGPRSPGGSSEASSTSPTTASIATSKPNGGRVAIYWEGEPVGDSRTITDSELLAPACKAANALTDLGLVAGDRAAIYMPMVPEAIISMLACARLGVMHSVVFAGFSATALKARIADAQAKLVITTDGQFRRGQAASLPSWRTRR